MNYIFLDTNIFIHFQDFEQIDWKKISNSEDEIIITIAPIVIDELDKHKYNKNQKISKRIKKLLPKFEKALENIQQLKYTLKIILKRPSENTFLENNLDKSEQDDCLLATIVEFQENLDSNSKVIYVTNDIGPRLKAKSLNISAVTLPEEYLLPNELDELEIKNKSLQKELNELKHRTPKVHLTFKDRSNLAIYKKEILKDTKEVFIKKQIETAKRETPYLIYNPPDKDLYKNPMFALLNNTPLFSLSETQIIEYNEDLNEYFKEYEVYASSLFHLYDFKVNSIKIELLLNNIGTAPAQDIDIEIHFPDGFELFGKDDLPKVKKKPTPPYKPKNRYDLNLGNISAIHSLIPPSPNRDLGAIDLNKPTIKKSNSYNVNYHLNSLKHNQFFDLAPLYARFQDITNAKGFQIDYKLIISNISNPIVGQMNINFEN